MNMCGTSHATFQSPHLVTPREFYFSLIELIDQAHDCQQAIQLIRIRITPGMNAFSEAYYVSCGLVLPAAMDALKNTFNQGEVIGYTDQPGEFLLAKLLVHPFRFDQLQRQLEALVATGNANLTRHCNFEVVWSYHIERVSLMTFPDRLIDSVNKAALFVAISSSSSILT